MMTDSRCVSCVQALVQPMKFLRVTRRVWRSVLVLWLLAAVVALPQLIAYVQTEELRLSPDSKHNIIIHKCEPAGYTAEWQRKLYFGFITLSLYFIPACIMIYCYSSIVRVVWLRASPEAARDIDQPRVRFRTRRSGAVPAVCIAEVVSSPGHHQPGPHLPRCQSLPMGSQVSVSVPRRMALTTKRSVIRMAMSVTVGFMVCWTPFFIVTSVRIYSDYQYPWKTANAISLLMALSHSAVNPLLYIISSKRAVCAAFVHLCQRAQPRCCQRR